MKQWIILSTYFFSFQIMKSEIMRISHELQAQKDKIKENTEKIKVNKTLPYLVSNVIEVRQSISISVLIKRSVKKLFSCSSKHSIFSAYSF